MRTTNDGSMDTFVAVGLTAIVASAFAGCVLYASLLTTLFLEHGVGGLRHAPGLIEGASDMLRGLLAQPSRPWLLYRGGSADVNQGAFWVVTALFVIVAATFAAAAYARFGVRTGEVTHGESRWASGRQLRRLGRRRFPSKLLPDGIVMGWLGRRVLQSYVEDNVLVFGVQRSGKTSTVVIPTLLGWGGAVVATSTKEELVRLTGRHRRRQGRVWVFAPLERDTSWITSLGLRPAVWNPVVEACDSGRAMEIADLFTSEGKQGPSSHWYLAASNLIAGLVLAARAKSLDLRAVIAWLNNLSHANFVGLAAQQSDPVAKELLTAFANTPSREAGSIASTARSCLSLWLDNRVAAATSSTAPPDMRLDLEELLANAGTLYLVAPAEEAERCRPLFTALLQSLLATATQRARRMEDGVLQPRLLLALDEVANFSRVPRLASYAATGPGQGIQILLCFHDMAQLEAAYGPEGARTIWNNCRARLLLPAQGDLRTLEHFSRSIGDETRRFELASWSDGRRSHSEQRIGKPLAGPDHLRRLKQPVLLYGSELPTKLSARRWDQVRQWRRIAGAPVTGRGAPLASRLLRLMALARGRAVATP